MELEIMEQFKQVSYDLLLNDNDDNDESSEEGVEAINIEVD